MCLSKNFRCCFESTPQSGLSAKPAMISHSVAALSSGSGLFSTRSRPNVGEIAAQPRQRPLVQKAGQIVGGIGQDFAASDPDEEVEILALHGVARARDATSARAAWARPSGVSSAIQFASAPSGSTARREQRGKQEHIPARAPASTGSTACPARPARCRVGAKHFARNSRCAFDRNHTLSGHPVPVGNGGLGNADFSRKLATPPALSIARARPGSRTWTSRSPTDP